MVSVIMPAYNSERCLEQSVASVRSQTAADWELLLIDDGSSDRTGELIARLAARDSRIVPLPNGTNRGVAFSRNRGIDRARGEWIAFLDSDDAWEPHKLERQLEEAARTGGRLCYASYDYVDGEGAPTGLVYRVPPQADYRLLLGQNVIGLSTALLHRELLGERRFDPRFFHEDYALWLALLRDGERAVGVPEVLTHYRTGGRSSDKRNAARERWRIYREGEGLSLPASLRHLLRYAYHGWRKFQ